MSGLKIMVPIAYYKPGYKAGGSIRTVSNSIDRLGNDFRFLVVTEDRDLGDSEPYADIRFNRWENRELCKVFYISLGKLRKTSKLLNLLSQTEYDILYLNSVFQPVFSILPLLWMKLGLVPSKPVVLGPRGEFSNAALAVKFRKKSFFLRFAKIVRLYDRTIWQASSPAELSDMRRVLGEKAVIVLATDAPSAIADRLAVKPVKTAGVLNLVFLSRVSRIKNLHFALSVVGKLSRCEVRFDLYGPIEDAGYWKECEEAIANLPAFVKARYMGPIPGEKVGAILGQYDLFFLPSLGEGFGHAIFEALSAGCPVLTSDRTPWTDLESQGCGWAHPLGNEQAFVASLEQAAAMDGAASREQCEAALRYAAHYSGSLPWREQNIAMFLQAHSRHLKAER